MFSLNWVITKAKIMGPAHLINDYVEYGFILDQEVRTQKNGHCVYCPFHIWDTRMRSVMGHFYLNIRHYHTNLWFLCISGFSWHKIS